MVKLPEYRYCNRHGEPKPCIYCRSSEVLDSPSHTPRKRNLEGGVYRCQKMYSGFNQNYIH